MKEEWFYNLDRSIIEIYHLNKDLFCDVHLLFYTISYCVYIYPKKQLRKETIKTFKPFKKLDVITKRYLIECSLEEVKYYE